MNRRDCRDGLVKCDCDQSLIRKKRRGEATERSEDGYFRTGGEILVWRRQGAQMLSHSCWIH